MSKASTIAAIALPVGIVALLGFGGTQVLGSMKPRAEKAEEAPRGLAIFTEPVVVDNLKLTVASQGEVRPRREIALSAQISGSVSSVSDKFIDGGFVRRGEVLVRIEDADYELARIRAQSQVASAEQRLIREQAESDIARRDWEELGEGTPSALALREPQLAEARASVDAAKAQLRDAELALERTVIRAPFDGRIRTKAVDIGQFVAPGQSLGIMFGTDIAEISLPLADEELGRLGLNLAFEETREQPGPNVILSADVAGKPRQWQGRITRTAAAINPQTRLISAIATVDDPFGEGADGDAPLAPGLFVTATIDGDTIENIMRAPRAALRKKNEVYVADPGTSTLKIRYVDVIYSDVNHVYMAGGIEPGELAITSPVQAPFDGMSITIAGLESNDDDGDNSNDEPLVADADETQEG